MLDWRFSIERKKLGAKLTHGVAMIKTLRNRFSVFSFSNRKYLQLVDRKPQRARSADEPIVVGGKGYRLSLLLEKVHRCQVEGVECSDRLRKDVRAQPRCRDRSTLAPVLVQFTLEVAEGHDGLARRRAGG